MKSLSIVTIVVVLAGLAGCASSTSTPQVSGPPANVAGSWNGATIGPSGAFVSMQLSQTGPAVTGNIDIGGRADLSGPISGTVNGNTVRFQLTSGYGSTGELNVKGNTINGFVGGTELNLQRK